jgi:ribose 1,5-bisphosphokinase
MARPLGSLVLVVGPSGVGKDTLIRGARHALGNDKRFVFVRRLVTRPTSIEVEDHEGLDPETFRQMDEAGRFALSWDAHNLRYALPLSVDTDLALGKTVVANVSRYVLGEAIAKYPACAVVLISSSIIQVPWPLASPPSSWPSVASPPRNEPKACRKRCPDY